MISCEKFSTLERNDRNYVYQIILTVLVLCIYCCEVCSSFEEHGSLACSANYGKPSQGICVAFSDCPKLDDILRSPHRTTEDLKLLQRLTCVPDPKNPKICCSIHDVSNPRKYGLTPTTTTKPPKSQGGWIYPTDEDEEGGSGTKGNGSLNGLKPETIDPNNDYSDPKQTLSRFGSGSRIHPNFRLLPTLNECSVRISSGRIIGGKDALLGSYPWMARIGYKNVETEEIEFYCGGTVINKRYILTAAHCTEEVDSSELIPVMVRLGEHDAENELDCSNGICSKVQDYKIEKVIPHASYSTEDKSNDIGLLRVDRNIEFDNFVRPVCLPFAKEYKIDNFLRVNDLDQFAGGKGTVSGWGRTRWNRVEGSRILQEVNLPIISNENCQQNYSTRVTISDSQMCAGGERGIDSCGGDSGGPIVVPVRLRDEQKRYKPKYFQIGVVSFGPVQCGIGGLPGVYSRVSAFKEWILNSIHS